MPPCKLIASSQYCFFHVNLSYFLPHCLLFLLFCGAFLPSFLCILSVSSVWTLEQTVLPKHEAICILWRQLLLIAGYAL